LEVVKCTIKCSDSICSGNVNWNLSKVRVSGAMIQFDKILAENIN